MENVNKMGFRNVIENLPGLSGMVKDEQLDVLQGKIEKWRFIIQSMTKDEKKDPNIINDARRKRTLSWFWNHRTRGERYDKTI